MADATRRVSVRLSVDGAQQAKSELRGVGEAGNRSLAQIVTGAQAASTALRLADVAECAVFFAGFESKALTGQSIIVSHGWTME
jgi:hypothetical protein